MSSSYDASRILQWFDVSVKLLTANGSEFIWVLDTARDPKAVVRILELRRNTGTRSATRHFDVVPPGASARGAASARFRSTWISFWRDCVVIRFIPITAPFVYVFTDVIKTESIRRVAGNRLRASLPSFFIIRQ